MSLALFSLLPRIWSVSIQWKKIKAGNRLSYSEQVIKGGRFIYFLKKNCNLSPDLVLIGALRGSFKKQSVFDWLIIWLIIFFSSVTPIFVNCTVPKMNEQKIEKQLKDTVLKGKRTVPQHSIRVSAFWAVDNCQSTEMSGKGTQKNH